MFFPYCNIARRNGSSEITGFAAAVHQLCLNKIVIKLTVEFDLEIYA